MHFRPAMSRVGLLVFGAIMTGLVLFGIKIGINRTESAKPGVYLACPGHHLEKHQWVAFEFPQASWAIQRGYVQPGALGIKKITAVPGEYLLTRHGQIYACSKPQWPDGCRWLGGCQAKDHQGRRMHCQHWQYDRIPKGHYYLGAQRVANSFDSRYFGWVDAHHIVYRLRLLYAFT